MGIKIVTIIVLIVFVLPMTQAQTRSTKSAKVVMIIDGKSNQVTGLELATEDNAGETLLKKYSNSKFCMGVIQGSYTLSKDGLTPLPGSTITIYPEMEFLPLKGVGSFLPDEQFLPDNQFRAGDPFDLGRVTTEVLSHKRGQMVVRVQ